MHLLRELKYFSDDFLHDVCIKVNITESRLMYQNSDVCKKQICRFFLDTHV